MTPEQGNALLASLKEMRRLQKLFFKSKNRLYMDAAKVVEKEVDRILAELEEPAAKVDLFSQGQAIE